MKVANVICRNKQATNNKKNKQRRREEKQRRAEKRDRSVDALVSCPDLKQG